MLGRGGDGGGKGSSQSGWWARDVAPRKRASRSAQEKVTALDEQARSDKRLQQSVKARMWTLQRSPVVCSDCCRQKREGRFGARCALPESEEGNGRDKTRQPLPRLTCLVAGVSCCRRRRRPRHTHRERGRVVVRSSSAARVRPVGSWDGWVCCGTCVLRCACVAVLRLRGRADRQTGRVWRRLRKWEARNWGGRGGGVECPGGQSQFPPHLTLQRTCGLPLWAVSQAASGRVLVPSRCAVTPSVACIGGWAR